MIVRIDKDIPLPPRSVGRPTAKKYPWDTMEIGDSFLHQASYITATTSAQRKALNGRKFSVRRMPDGIRIWRVE